MEAVRDREPLDVETHLTFETAAEHATARGPVAGPTQRAGDVRDLLAHAVGTQTETVVVRGLSLGVPMRRMVGRELLAGILIGVTLAAVALPFVWWRWNDAGLAFSVGLSVFAACSTATVAAMALPWMFDAFACSPAFGSGSLATVVQDLLSIWIYLSVTTLVMSG